MLKLTQHISLTPDVIEAPNLADRFSVEDRAAIGMKVWQGYDRDLFSRLPWERRMESGMNLAMQVTKDKNFPWPGSANVVFPLITIAALQFSARSYGNLIVPPDVVQYRVTQEDPTGDLRLRADRISKHMSWQVLEGDQGWEEQHDRLFINLAIVGTAFIKTYFSPSRKHNVSELVLARDLVIDYYAKSVEAASRKTQRIPLFRNELYERMAQDQYIDYRNEAWFNGPARPSNQPTVDYRTGQVQPQSDQDTPFMGLEQHCYLDLDGDGYAEPYIATIEESSKCLLRLVARFEDRDVTRRGKTIQAIQPTEYYTKYSFIPAPDSGIYDIGFGVLLGPLNEAVNSGINQLLDAGTMSNSTGGFLGRGAKIRGGGISMAPWEWKRVDSTGDDLRKSMVPLPVREPSAVLFNLLGLLINYTDRISGSVDIMVGVNPGQNTPAETSRNMIEQGMQVYTAIFKRVWRSMKNEFKKLHGLNAIYLNEREKFGSTGATALREDYQSDPEQICPSADPHVTSAQMRIMKATLLRQAAYSAPGYNRDEVERRYLRALQIEGIDNVYVGIEKSPPPEDPKLAIEKLRLQEKALKHQIQREQFAYTLMETRKLNEAKIEQLRAQAASLVAGIGGAQASHELEVFDTVLAHLNEHNQLMNERIQTLLSGGNDGDESGDTGGGAGGMGALAQGSGDAGSMGGPQPLAGGDQGAMGGGELR